MLSHLAASLSVLNLVRANSLVLLLCGKYRGGGGETTEVCQPSWCNHSATGQPYLRDVADILIAMGDMCMTCLTIVIAIANFALAYSIDELEWFPD